MSDTAETAILAGGCFWIMQQLLRHPEGVLSTRTGWTGGESDDPTEDDPGGHAEAVEIFFDPHRISYRGLLEFFFQAHRADLDEHLVGAQYRSEIFCTSDRQRVIAAETVADFDASGHWPGRIVTNISEAGPFWVAAPEDQDYFQRHHAEHTSVSAWTRSRLEPPPAPCRRHHDPSRPLATCVARPKCRTE
jgi:peptide-methionine (S)-S-oxide reductase